MTKPTTQTVGHVTMRGPAKRPDACREQNPTMTVSRLPGCIRVALAGENGQTTYIDLQPWSADALCAAPEKAIQQNPY